MKKAMKIDYESQALFIKKYFYELRLLVRQTSITL